MPAPIFFLGIPGQHAHPVLYLRKETTRFMRSEPAFERPIGHLTHSNSAYNAIVSRSLALSPATYVNTWSGYVEGGMYILAAIVLVTAAYYAVVELR